MSAGCQGGTCLPPAASLFPSAWLCWLAEVKVAQLCLTLCDRMNYTVHGILQARILEWVAVPFSGGSSHPRNQTQVSCIAGGFFTSWDTRETQEYCSGWPISSSGDLPNPGIKPRFPALETDSLPAEPQGNSLDSRMCGQDGVFQSQAARTST